ncbi:MAG: hypothetical protein ACI4N3_03950 [Alphaproteobacteria bacterium]
MHRILSESEKRFICEMVRYELALGKPLTSILNTIEINMGIRKNEIYLWNKKFGMIFKNNSFSESEKITILEMVVEKMLFGISLGQAVRDVADKFNIEKHAIYRWNRIFDVFKTSKLFNDNDRIKICEYVNNSIKLGENTGSAVQNASNNFGVSIKSIYEWNRVFKIFYTRDYGNRETSFSDEFIKMVVKDIKSIGGGEKNINLIAEKYKISPSTVYKWRRSR